MKRIEKIKCIDSLLEGDHNLTKEQKRFLQSLKTEVLRAKTYGDLKILCSELLKFLAQLYLET